MVSTIKTYLYMLKDDLDISEHSPRMFGQILAIHSFWLRGA